MKLSPKGKIKLENYLCAYAAYVSGLCPYEPHPIMLERSDFKNAALSRLIDEIQEGHVLTDAEAETLANIQLKIVQAEKRE